MLLLSEDANMVKEALKADVPAMKYTELNASLLDYSKRHKCSFFDSTAEARSLRDESVVLDQANVSVGGKKKTHRAHCDLYFGWSFLQLCRFWQSLVSGPARQLADDALAKSRILKRSATESATERYGFAKD